MSKRLKDNDAIFTIIRASFRTGKRFSVALKLLHFTKWHLHLAEDFKEDSISNVIENAESN